MLTTMNSTISDVDTYSLLALYNNLSIMQNDTNHKSGGREMPTIVHFDVAADNPDRAKKFCEGLFDWKMENPPGMTD